MSDHEVTHAALSPRIASRLNVVASAGILVLAGFAGLAGAQTETAVSARAALLATCVTGRNGTNQFQDDCNAIFTSSSSVSDNAIDQVAADQVTAQNAASTRQFRTNLGAVGGRLARIRVAGNQFEIDEGLGLVYSGESLGTSGGGASGDADFGRMGGFLTMRYRWGDQDLNAFQPGFDFDGWGAIGGVDYRLDDNTVAGIALNYMSDDVDYDGNRGDLESDSWGLTVYGTWYRDDGLYLDGMLGYSWVDYDLDRVLTYTTDGAPAQNVNQVASSSADGKMFSAAIGGGYDLAQGSTTYTPSLRLEYIRNEVDGFTESMSNPGADGGGMAVSVSDATYKSLTSRLGLQVSHAISTARGVVSPSVQLDWVHEFDNDQQRVGGQFISDALANGTPFLVVTDKPDRNYFDLRLAVAGQFAQGASAFLSYNTLLGFDDLSYHAVNAGVRLEF